MEARQYSRCKFVPDMGSIEDYPRLRGEQYFIYLGEIPNMLGHCVVAGDSGKIYSGYHCENFVELTEEDF